MKTQIGPFYILDFNIYIIQLKYERNDQTGITNLIAKSALDRDRYSKMLKIVNDYREPAPLLEFVLGQINENHDASVTDSEDYQIALKRQIGGPAYLFVNPLAYKLLKNKLKAQNIDIDLVVEIPENIRNQAVEDVMLELDQRYR